MSYLISLLVHIFVIYLILFFNPQFFTNFKNPSRAGFITLVKSEHNQDNNLDYKKQNSKNNKNKTNIVMQMDFSGNLNTGKLNSYVLKKGELEPPIYPEKAIENKHEGVVFLVILLNTFSEVENVFLQKTSGYAELDKIALTNAKKKWIGKKIENSSSKKIMIHIKFSLIK